MWRHQQAVLVFAVIALSYTAAKPTTQDTLVVTRSEDESTTPAVPSSETTEEPNAPIKLTEMDVQSRISLRYAHTAVVTHVRNPARRAQETTFRMLLPDTAFISGFTMTIDGKAYKAYVKGKEEAKQVYNEAVSQGLGAAHIAAKARDSNHFTVSVNVEPSSSVVFNLTYEELLVRRNGVYNHAVNLHPGTLVPKMKVTVHIKEAEKISTLRVPEVRTGNEVDASEDDPQNPNAVIKRTHDDREAIITFTPDVDEQKRLIHVYTEKSRQSLGNQHRYYPEDNEETDKEGVLGQFVVQYDVDRSKAGEILVNDGYFVHFFAPTSLPPLPKHVVFVLDTSGSMIGRKIEQLREAMQTILSKLNEADYFSIVEFNSYVKVHDLSEADKVESSTKRYYYFELSQEPTNLVAPSQATSENKAKAKIIVSRLDAGGGTNIASALDIAVDLIHKGAVWKKSDNQSESKIEDATENKTTKDDDNVSNKQEPIIIFLTDGDPTVGETDPTRIINRLSEKNVGEQKASIYTLGFGEDADRNFLRKLSLRNEGFMRHIYEAADAALQLRDFYRTVSSPLLADVKFLYPKAQIKEGSLTKHSFRTYYAGSETVVAGRIDDGVTEIQPQVLAFCGVEDGKGRKRYEISPKVPVVRTSVQYYPLERLWAYLTIKQLLDEKDAFIESKNDKDKETKNNLEKKALDIALKYEFVTPLTSLVVVKPNDTKAVDAESVDDKPTFENYQAVRPLSSPNGFPSSHRLMALSRPSASFGAYAAAGPLPAYAFSPISSGSFKPQQSLLMSPLDSVSGAGLPGPPGPLFESDVMAFEEEDTDSDRIYDSPQIFGYASTTPYNGPPIVFTSVAPSTTSDPLEPYSLKQFPWALPLLNVGSDSLVLNVNGTEVTLKLTKDDAESPASNDKECSNSTDGDAGRCVYLTRCDAARSISAELYKSAFCVVDNGYAGVCCPKSKDDAPNP